MDEKKLEVMKMVVNGEKLEAEPYIRTTHPTQTKSKYFGEELQCSSIPQFKLISRLNLAFFSGLLNLKLQCSNKRGIVIIIILFRITCSRLFVSWALTVQFFQVGGFFCLGQKSTSFI